MTSPIHQRRLLAARAARAGAAGPSPSRLFELSRVDLRDILASAAANTAALPVVTDDESNNRSRRLDPKGGDA